MTVKPSRGGRPPLGEVAKSAPMNLRTRPDIRAQIEEAARKNGRSLSEEAGLRVEQSFQNELFSMTGLAAIRRVEQITGKSWLDDFDTFEAAIAAVYRALRTLQPRLPFEEQSKAEALRAELEKASERLKNSAELVRENVPVPGPPSPTRSLGAGQSQQNWWAPTILGGNWIPGLLCLPPAHVLAETYLTDAQIEEACWALSPDQAAIVRAHQSNARQFKAAQSAYDEGRDALKARMVAAQKLEENIVETLGLSAAVRPFTTLSKTPEANP